MRRQALCLLCLCLAMPAVADEEPEEKGPDKPGVPLKLSLVYTRHQGDKKVSSLPYTLLLNADDRLGSRLRMGISVPIKVKDPDVPGNIVFKDVSNNIDCRASTLADGRYNVRCVIEQSSVYQAPGASGDLTISSTPVLRIFRADEAMILRDGQTTQYTSATDPVSGEVLKVDVTLNVMK
jgi:hypothetical protein